MGPVSEFSQPPKRALVDEIDGSAELLGERRGPVLETIHRGHIAVVDAGGALLYRAGQPERFRTYMRSTAKPFQAIAVVAAGVVEALDLSARHLAVMCGSHQGEESHIKVVRDILRRLDRSEEELLCGLPPEPDRRRIAAANQCSGKHVGMLATAVCRYQAPGGYALPSHPVQEAVADTVSVFLQTDRDSLLMGGDSCGVPTFGTSVHRMALAYARLAASDSLPAALVASARQVLGAMTAHPELLEGGGQFDTELCRHTGGRIVTKSGAGGVQSACEFRRGLGISVKIDDGDGPAARAVLIEVLVQLDLLSPPLSGPLSDYYRPTGRNALGQEVVWTVPLFQLA